MPYWLTALGRVFYALGLIGIGIQHFIFSDFIAVMIPYWPPSIPGREFWAWGLGLALVAAGCALALDLRVGTTAIVLGTVIVVWVVADHLPFTLSGHPGSLAVWSNPLKALTLAGGAWVMSGRDNLVAVGRFFLAVMLVVFGVTHFVYPAFVATLVPAWIPWHSFWTYFAGVALIAAGLALITGIQARLAALLLGTMIFLWFLVLHIPRAIADPHSGRGNEWTSVFEALAFSGIAFILASRAEKRGR